MSLDKERGKMTLKVGFLTERLLLGFGVDLVVHQYARLLHARGDDVEVFCLRNDASVARSYRVTNLTTCQDLLITGSMSRNIISFAAFCNARDVDVWIVNTPPFYDVMPLLTKPAIAIEYGTPPSHFFNAEVGRNLDAAIAYRFTRVFPRLRQQDKILCISKSIRSWLPQKVRMLSEVLYLACDHYPVASADEARQFRQGLNIDDDAFMLLWVGRVQVVGDEQPYKGFIWFVELAKDLLNSMPEIKIVVVGRGGVEEEAFLKSRGVIPSLNLPDSQMGAAFAASDLFVSTSLWEGFNLPLLEAQYQGTPVVAYRHGPHPEVVSDGVTGLLVADQKEMLVAILSLARDPVALRALAQETKAFAAGFSWQKSVEGLKAAALTAINMAAAGAQGDVPAINVKGWRQYSFQIGETYVRYGFVFLIKRIAQALRARLFGAFRRGDPA